ncbi:MAG: ArsR/SmtB family transcription factor, partial [Owenweeksia sp.]
MRRDVFQAIADPTRREIIGLISQEPLNLNSVAEKFEISRPAISKHIKMLEECGIVVIKKRGRERYCYPQLESLNEVHEWIEQYRQFWEAKLDSLEKYLEILKSKNND